MIAEAETFFLIRRALASSRLPVELLRRRQERAMRQLLDHAYGNVPMYRRLYDAAGFHPSDFRSLDDVKAIPPLTKGFFQHTPPGERVAAGTDLARCRTVRTSGSTGAPLQIAFGPGDVRWQRAVAWRILFENGFRWTHRTLEIRVQVQPPHFLQRFGIAPKDWVSLLEPPQRWVDLFLEKKPESVVAGAGTLHALAEALLERGVRHVPRLVISDSETLAPATRALVREAMGCDPCDVYGLEEMSNFAWQCECRGGFHVSEDSHLVEVDAPPGEAGPLTATALLSRATPMIRYETGDWAERAVKPCPCGRTLGLLARIHGRSVDSISLPDGSKIFWPFFHTVVGGRTELARWRVVQTSPRGLRLEFQPLPGRRVDADELRGLLASKLPMELQVAAVRVDDFRVPPGTKFRAVVAFSGGGG